MQPILMAVRTSTPSFWTTSIAVCTQSTTKSLRTVFPETYTPFSAGQGLPCHMKRKDSSRTTTWQPLYSSCISLFQAIRFYSIQLNTVPFHSIHFNPIQFISILFYSFQFNSIHFHSILYCDGVVLADCGRAAQNAQENGTTITEKHLVMDPHRWHSR